VSVFRSIMNLFLLIQYIYTTTLFYTLGVKYIILHRTGAISLLAQFGRCILGNKFLSLRKQGRCGGVCECV